MDSFAPLLRPCLVTPKQGAACGDTRAAGKQVLTNGPSSLAGAISPTAVSERWLGCGAERAPFRRRRSTDDRPALATARTAGGADPWLSDSTHDRHAGIAACRAGVRFFLAEPPPLRDCRPRWARLDPGALSRRGGRSRRRRVDLMPNSQKSAGWTVCASNHAVTAQLILRRIKRAGLP